MYPLIEIKTVPIEIEMKTINSKFEYQRGTAEMEISRDKGGLNVKSRPIRVNIDTFEARSSLSPTAMRSIEQSADRGKEASYEATATYARQGQLLLTAKIGDDLLTQFAKESTMKGFKPNVGIQFLPDAPAEITWDAGELNIRYEMDKLNFDWKLSNGDFKFTPGDIEFSITQRPDVVIRYLGDPIYVPPSANPELRFVDVEA